MSGLYVAQGTSNRFDGEANRHYLKQCSYLYVPSMHCGGLVVDFG
jgi:hypothetical protein